MDEIRSIRNILQNTALILISSALALSAIEIVLQHSQPTFYMNDAVLGSIGRPGANNGEYDANGFRNTKVLSQAEIVAIGDSQTYGDNAAVEDAWPQQLGRIASTSVYQFAWGGYGPMEYLALADRAIALKPKIVVVGFYLGNDLENATRMTYAKDIWSAYRKPGFVVPKVAPADAADDVRYAMQTGLAPESFMLKVYRTRLWVRSHSKIYALLGDATRAFREAIGVAKTKQEKTSQINGFANTHPEIMTAYTQGSISTLLSPKYRYDVVDLDYPYTREGWRITQLVLNEMHRKLTQEGIRMVVVIIPTKELVYAKYLAEDDSKDLVALKQYGSKEGAVEQATLQYCKEEGIYCVDALPGMVSALKHDVAIFPPSGNSHPVASGYKVIAESVWGFLKTTAI